MIHNPCTTCKHMRDPGPFARCLAPQNQHPDNTGFGRAHFKVEFCHAQRLPGKLETLLWRVCGKEGRWWELK